MNANTNSRLAVVAGSLYAAVGALQTTNLHWQENVVKTPLQHLTMALFATALVVSIPPTRQLARGNRAWVAIAVGQIGVAAASTVSNLRGVDAGWFPAAAIARSCSGSSARSRSRSRSTAPAGGSSHSASSSPTSARSRSPSSAAASSRAASGSQSPT